MKKSKSSFVFVLAATVIIFSMVSVMNLNAYFECTCVNEECSENLCDKCIPRRCIAVVPASSYCFNQDCKTTYEVYCETAFGYRVKYATCSIDCAQCGI